MNGMHASLQAIEVLDGASILLTASLELHPMCKNTIAALGCRQQQRAASGQGS